MTELATDVVAQAKMVASELNNQHKEKSV